MGQCPTWWSPCQTQVAPSVQRHKVWLTPTTTCRAVTLPRRETRSKFAGVPQTTGRISAVSRTKFTMLWGHVEDMPLLNEFFSECRCVPWLRRYSPTNLCDGAQMAIFVDFLRPAFPASRVQQVSDLHLKFALRPHHVWKYGRHPMYGRWD